MRVIDVFAKIVSGFSYFWHNYASWFVFFVGVIVFACEKIADRKGGVSKDNSELFDKKINVEKEKSRDKIDVLPIKEEEQRDKIDVLPIKEEEQRDKEVALPIKEEGSCGVVRNYIEPGTFSQIAENYRRLRAEEKREKEAKGETVECYPTWEERELELLEYLAKERGETKKYL